MYSQGVKRSRDVNVAVPETPRKRRVLGLQTPETTPKKQKLTTPKTPSSSTSKIGTSPYSPVKSVLRRSAAAQTVGRERELRVIDTFISGEEGMLYICGPPGTGKSSTVTHYTTLQLEDRPDAQQYRLVELNCASIKRPGEIYGRIMEELQETGTNKLQFRRHLERSTTKVLLVLDEIDYLTSDLETMYSLFELSRTSAQLKVIGIANALDLTDKTLPLLRKSGIQPQVLRFKPYSPAQITAILTHRISSIALPASCTCLVQKPALDFIGRKVANGTGDIRQALDLLRRAIEMVESEYRGALTSLSSNTATRTVSPVTMKHVSQATSSSLSSVPVSTRVAALGIHEKAALCTMIVRKTSTTQSTFEAYVALCQRNKLLTPFPRTDFYAVLSGLLDKGLLTTSKRGVSSSPSKKSQIKEEKIALDVSEMDILQGISDIDILKRFFDTY